MRLIFCVIFWDAMSATRGKATVESRRTAAGPRALVFILSDKGEETRVLIEAPDSAFTGTTHGDEDTNSCHLRWVHKDAQNPIVIQLDNQVERNSDSGMFVPRTMLP